MFGCEHNIRCPEERIGASGKNGNAPKSGVEHFRLSLATNMHILRFEEVRRDAKRPLEFVCALGSDDWVVYILKHRDLGSAFLDAGEIELPIGFFRERPRMVVEVGVHEPSGEDEFPYRRGEPLHNPERHYRAQTMTQKDGVEIEMCVFEDKPHLLGDISRGRMRERRNLDCIPPRLKLRLKPREEVSLGRPLKTVQKHKIRFFGAPDVEIELRAFAFSYPIALCDLYFFRPVELPEIRKELVRIFRDTKKPLLQIFLNRHRRATFTFPIDHLLVGKHGFTGRTPIDRLFFSVRETRLEKFRKDPLRPTIIVRVVRLELLAPRETVSYLLKLFIKTLRRDARLRHRVRSDFHRIVFGMYSESVEANGLKHIVALHSLEPPVDVAPGECIHIAHMKSLRRRVRKHHEVVELLFCGFCHRGFVNPFLLPGFLPLFFDFRKIKFFLHANERIEIVAEIMNKKQTQKWVCFYSALSYLRFMLRQLNLLTDEQKPSKKRMQASQR